MSAARRGDSGSYHRARRRLAAFALASVALHAVALAIFQIGARRGPKFAPESAPVQFVELAPPVTPEPDAPDIAEDLPEPAPPEIPQTPEPEPEPGPEPQIPNPPSPEPEVPQEPADISPPEPAPDGGAAAAPAPQPDLEEDEDAALILPGLAYRGDGDSQLARFGHVLECAALDMRYDEYCADVGPVYLTREDIENLLPGDQVTPEIIQAWKAQDAEMAAAQYMRDNGDMDAVVPCGFGGVCVPPPERFDARRQGIRDGLRELGVID